MNCMVTISQYNYTPKGVQSDDEEIRCKCLGPCTMYMNECMQKEVRAVIFACYLQFDFHAPWATLSAAQNRTRAPHVSYQSK